MLPYHYYYRVLTSPVKAAKKPSPPQVDVKPTVAGPVLMKWNALDVDRVYAGGKEERTYSQAFAKKMSSSANKQPYKVLAQNRKEREKGTAFQGASVAGHTSEESETTPTAAFSISLEGRGLDRGGDGATNGTKAPQQKKRVKKTDAHQTHSKNTIGLSLLSSQEGSNRPTIERGGTNTILMEVSGVGSRSANEAQTTLLSQNTKESFARKKKNYQTKDDYEIPDKSSPQQSSPFRSEASSESTSTTSSSISSAPVEMTHRRNRHKKREAGGRTKPQSHQTSRGGATLTVTDVDSPLSAGGTSPQEHDGALLESQVHSNPEQALKTAHQSMDSDVWSNKCEGITMVMCVARHYPTLLLPQLHTTLLAVQKEVCYSIK